MKPSEVPIPPKLRMRPKDKRGYPVPWIVMVDLDGQPHFVLNNANKVHTAVMRGICALCGKKLERDRWLIGGPSAAFHEHGAYIDPPVHHQCGEYALKVCPYLATSYSRRLETKALKNARFQDDVTIVIDDTAMPKQPPFYVFVRTTGVTRFQAQPGVHYMTPKRPFNDVEFWNRGEQIGAEEAKRLLVGDDDTTYTVADLKHWQDE